MKQTVIASCAFAISAVLLSEPIYADHNRGFFSNENIGRIVGTGMGALLGSEVGKGRGNDAAIAAGAVGGYILGGKIGRDWNSGSRPSKVSSHHRQQRSKRTGYLQPVQAMPDLEVIDSTYYANTTSNVRGGPSMKYVIVEGLRPGERVRVLGRVTDTNWYMISQQDIIQGFVHMNLLEPSQETYSYNTNY